MAERQLQVDHPTFIPSNIQAGAGDIILCWDNNDIIEETKCGAGTTHCTNGIVVQGVQCVPGDSCEKPYKRQEQQVWANADGPDLFSPSNDSL